MPTPGAYDAESTLDSAVDQWDTTMAALSFSHALRLTRELAFGILAVLGCVVVQCLIVSWILVSTVQINFVLLQARLLCVIYRGTFEKLPSVKATRAVPTASQPAPSNLHSPSQKPPTEHLRKDVDQMQQNEVSAPDNDQPEATLATQTTTWQTKALRSRKVGHGRSYAVKQVDVPVPSSFAPQVSGDERSHAIKRSDVSIPPGLIPQPFETTGAYAERRVVPSIPPGFEAQISVRKATTGDTSEQMPMNGFYDGFNPKAASFEPDDDIETLKPADQLFYSDTTTDESSVQTPTSVFPGSLNPKAALFQSGNDIQTSMASEQLFASTKVAVRLPSRDSDNTIRAARQITAEARQTSANMGQPASLWNNERSTGPVDIASRKRIARSSAIKIVQPAQTSGPVSGHPTNQAVNMISKVEAGDQVVEAALESVQNGAVEVSPLTDMFNDGLKTPLTAILSPLTPEEAAREALKTAYREREAFRKKLTTGYSQERALEFAEKARTYKEKRQDLAACMPWGELSIADEQEFPYLSTKDTVEPQVNDTVTAVGETPKEPSLLPSPPSSSENAFPLQPRADPAPLIIKASMAYKVLLRSTKNLEHECPACNSRFCHEAYTGNSKQKLKSARDLYLKTRSTLMDAYDGGELPEEVAKKVPGIVEC